MSEIFYNLNSDENDLIEFKAKSIKLKMGWYLSNPTVNHEIILEDGDHFNTESTIFIIGDNVLYGCGITQIAGPYTEISRFVISPTKMEPIDSNSNIQRLIREHILNKII